MIAGRDCRSLVRFKVLRVFSGPSTDLGARAKQVIRAELRQGDADR
jgi:hypothetical protein